MGARVFAELEELRDLNERRELEKAKQALEAQVQQKELLLKEVNHRVKNSLQIVSSILSLQVADVDGTEAAAAIRNAAARVLAIAAVHERLYTGEDPRGSALTPSCATCVTTLPGLPAGRMGSRRMSNASTCRRTWWFRLP